MTHPLAKNLTDKERTLLALLVEGCTNREISKRRGLAEGTVKTVLHRVYDKLGVRGRTEAAVMAVRMGIGI